MGVVLKRVQIQKEKSLQPRFKARPELSSRALLSE